MKNSEQLMVNHKWLMDFKQRHNRTPIILHIGNIANNAYNNAKLLNKIGIVNDVLCYDYYHIMGCPEWEDADFQGDWEDDFFPKWHKVDLNKFNRPKWFAQGPMRFCIKYLTARRKDQWWKAFFYWHVLKLFWYKQPMKALKDLKTRKTRKTRKAFLSRKFLKYGGFFSIVFLCGFLGKTFIHFREPLFVSMQILSAIGLFSLLFFEIKNIKKEKIDFNKSKYFNGLISKLIVTFSACFPGRTDNLLIDDLIAYKSTIEKFEKLLKNYDIVIGYSTDGIYPLLAEKHPYIAFEHGTIREIPFKSDTQGRITSLVYSEADHIFITNADCIESAKKISKQPFTFINHPFDEDHSLEIQGVEENRKHFLQLLDASFLFFFPTRQDWCEGATYSDKNNDVFLKAFIDLRKKGYKVGMICCDWGENVPESKALLSKNSVESHVFWTNPMAIVKFERTALACDVVVDQFKLGAFGGVLFKAMATGSACLTYLDKKSMTDIYNSVPPVINSRTTDQIITSLIPLIQKPALLADIGNKCRSWIKEHYNSNETIKLQLDAFEMALKKTGDL